MQRRIAMCLYIPMVLRGTPCLCVSVLIRPEFANEHGDTETLRITENSNNFKWLHWYIKPLNHFKGKIINVFPSRESVDPPNTTDYIGKKYFISILKHLK